MFWLLKKIISLLESLQQILRKGLVVVAPKKVSVQLAGTTIVLDNATKDGLTSMLIMNDREWEREEIRLFTSLVPHADVILDIGANVGVYSVLSGKINPKAEVFAFEPHPGNGKRLLRNLALNEIKNCTLVEAAVGSASGEISFFVPANDSSTSVSSANEVFTGSWHDQMKELKVPLVALDTFVPEKIGKRVDLLKMDVEYYELPVLQGARNFLMTQKPALLCEVNIYEILSYYLPNMKDKIDKNVSFEIEKFFKEIGYTIYSLGLDGVLRVDTLHIHPDQRNFLFSAYKSPELFIPYSNSERMKALLLKG